MNLPLNVLVEWQLVLVLSVPWCSQLLEKRASAILLKCSTFIIVYHFICSVNFNPKAKLSKLCMSPFLFKCCLNVLLIFLPGYCICVLFLWWLDAASLNVSLWLAAFMRHLVCLEELAEALRRTLPTFSLHSRRFARVRSVFCLDANAW